MSSTGVDEKPKFFEERRYMRIGQYFILGAFKFNVHQPLVDFQINKFICFIELTSIFTRTKVGLPLKFG